MLLLIEMMRVIAGTLLVCLVLWRVGMIVQDCMDARGRT